MIPGLATPPQRSAAESAESASGQGAAAIGESLLHRIVETATDDGSSPLPKLAAFAAFQSGIRERCAEPPLARTAAVVGNYRMLGEN